MREEIEVLGTLSGHRVWGGFGGEGVVIRSEEPVDFHPSHKVVNVVPVASLDDAIGFANVATQTVGVFPSERLHSLAQARALGGGRGLTGQPRRRDRRASIYAAAWYFQCRMTCMPHSFL